RLHQLLYPLDDRTRSQVLQDLTQAAQLPDERYCSPRGLTPEEVRRLSESDVVDIGAHTTTHASLAHQTVAEQRCEIQESHRVLEAIAPQSPILNISGERKVGGGWLWTGSNCLPILLDR